MWQKIGIFTKIIVLVNVVSYCLQQYFDVSYEYLSMCLVPVADALQFYRYFTSEFTHGNLAHIASNMLIFLLYGWEVEKTYGTLFYGSLNFLIMALSNSLNILFVWLLAFVWPYYLGGGISHLAVCSVGYSNIIFGLMMVFAF